MMTDDVLLIQFIHFMDYSQAAQGCSKIRCMWHLSADFMQDNTLEYAEKLAESGLNKRSFFHI